MHCWRWSTMKPTDNLCYMLAIACSVACATQAFVLHAESHLQSYGLRLRPGVTSQAACISAGTRPQASFVGAPVVQSVLRGGKASRRGRSGRGRSMGMLFDDTILGVGGPELLLILVVGYFVLGPIELFRLTKQAGIVVGQLKDIGLGTATNLGNIMNQQLEQADKVASGAIPAWNANPEEPLGDEDEYEDVLVDEFDRVVVNNEVRPPPTNPEEEEPFWQGWADKARETANEYGLGFDSEQSPVKQVSKFAEQLSGKVNEKVMQMTASADASAADEWTGVEAGSAADWDSSEMGMGKAWTSGTEDLGPEAYELMNDVPQELTMDEQFERLDAIASLEKQRALTMQRLEARIEAKMSSIKNELLELVDEDYQERRARVDREFRAKQRAKTAAAPITVEGVGGAVGERGGKESKVEINGESSQGVEQSEVTAAKETAGVDRV